MLDSGRRLCLKGPSSKEDVYRDKIMKCVIRSGICNLSRVPIYTAHTALKFETK